MRHRVGLSVSRDMRTAIGSVEPGLPVVAVQSFDDAVALPLLPQRLAAWVTGSAGAVGIFLAALGLYGLAAFLVAQRTREIAICMALGASRRDVRQMVLGQAARLGAVGAVAGLALGSRLGLVIQSLSLLIGVPPFDPATVGGMTVLISAVLLAASYLPARRAASMNPAVALRAE